MKDRCLERVFPSGGSALRRARRRRGERGATMFLVTLVMALLTGMGIFAARAASMTEAASGYDRLNEQTHYMLQHGVALVVGELGRAPDQYADPTKPQMKQACFAGQWVTGPVDKVSFPCAKFNSDSLAASGSVAQMAGGAAITPPITPPVGLNVNPAANIPGSLGPTLLNPKLFIEYSDFGRAGRPPAGSSVGGAASQKFVYLQATLSAWAQIGPYTSAANTCGVAEINAALVTARETGRSYVVVGPVPIQNSSQ
jgi:hypothetical protein